MKSKLNLLREYATRKRTGFLNDIYKALPDPDKILEENNYDYGIYRDFLTDPHLMAVFPKVKLNKKEAVVEESAERDKILKEMGVNFTKEYFMKRYTDGDFTLVETGK